MSQLIGSFRKSLVAILNQSYPHFVLFPLLIRSSSNAPADSVLFDRKNNFTPRKSKKPFAAREILFDGYLMRNDFIVQTNTFCRFIPVNEKSRNLGRSRDFYSPPSGYAAVQWFGGTLVNVSHLRKTFFRPFLFDGKSSIADTKPGIHCAAREFLFDGYLMERLKHLSLRPGLPGAVTLPELISKFFPFSADRPLSSRLSLPR